MWQQKILTQKYTVHVTAVTITASETNISVKTKNYATVQFSRLIFIINSK